MGGEVIRTYRCPITLVEDLWPSIAHWADLACEYHPFLAGEDVLTLMLSGQCSLFLAADGGGVLGFAAAEVVEYPRCKVANVVAAGGRFGFLATLAGPIREQIEAWGREQGAHVFSAFGRAGWMRVADRIEGGHALPIAVIWKEIPHGRRRQEADNHSNPRPVVAGDARTH
jgi:hypothetical protein